MPEISDEDLNKLKANAEKATKLETELAELKKKGEPPPKPGDNKDDDKDGKDKDLVGKTRQAELDAEATKAKSKNLESSIKFNLSISKFVEDNKAILPAEVSKILETAEKEKYDSETDKAAAIKSAMVQSYFSIQANTDLLTESQKAAFDEWLKLTKTAREQKASEIFQNVFEPTLVSARMVKKAEELHKAKSGLASTGNTVMDNYKQRLVDGSQKAHLGQVKEKS